MFSWGFYALYGCVDAKRYTVLLDLFDILSELARDGHTRTQLRHLKVRSVEMLISFERTGPLQEHTVMYHLIIELIQQAIRWGPPSVVWCYALERIMGHLVRGIKSKRHAEANLMSRYRSTLVPCEALDLPRFQPLVAVFSQDTKSAPVDKFPTRSRDGLYALLPDDAEDLHPILLKLSQTYRRVAWESGLVHVQSASPGRDIQRWAPWSMPQYTGSKRWKKNNQGSLAAAVVAVQFSNVRMIHSGVFCAGHRRTGSNVVAATSEHKHECSIFSFKTGALVGRLAKILFMFKLEFAECDVAQEVRSTCDHFPMVSCLNKVSVFWPRTLSGNFISPRCRFSMIVVSVRRQNDL
jgi:hypothetical protein